MRPGEDHFWALVDELREVDGRVDEGTMMGRRCARVAAQGPGHGTGFYVAQPACLS